MSPASRRDRLYRHDDEGSAVVDFVLVGALIIVLTVSVLQLAVALHVRNTIIDAASEGARFGALAGNSLASGVDRTRELITTALGADYAANVTATRGQFSGHPAAIVTVVTPLPLLGLVGIDHGLEVRGHAAIETLP